MWVSTPLHEMEESAFMSREDSVTYLILKRQRATKQLPTLLEYHINHPYNGWKSIDDINFTPVQLESFGIYALKVFPMLLRDFHTGQLNVMTSETNHFCVGKVRNGCVKLSDEFISYFHQRYVTQLDGHWRIFINFLW